MSSRRILYDLFYATSYGEITDPGDAQTINVNRQSARVNVVTEGVETRTLAAPTKDGLTCLVILKTDGGNLTLTVTSGYDQAANTSITYADPGDYVMFHSVMVGASYYWRVLDSEGTTLATSPEEALSGVTPGTVAAGKAVIVDSNKAIGTFSSVSMNAATLTNLNVSTGLTVPSIVANTAISANSILATNVSIGTGLTAPSIVANTAISAASVLATNVSIGTGLTAPSIVADTAISAASILATNVSIGTGLTAPSIVANTAISAASILATNVSVGTALTAPSVVATQLSALSTASIGSVIATALTAPSVVATDITATGTAAVGSVLATAATATALNVGTGGMVNTNKGPICGLTYATGTSGATASNCPVVGAPIAMIAVTDATKNYFRLPAPVLGLCCNVVNRGGSTIGLLGNAGESLASATSSALATANAAGCAFDLVCDGTDWWKRAQ